MLPYLALFLAPGIIRKNPVHPHLPHPLHIFRFIHGKNEDFPPIPMNAVHEPRRDMRQRHMNGPRPQLPRRRTKHARPPAKQNADPKTRPPQLPQLAPVKGRNKKILGSPAPVHIFAKQLENRPRRVQTLQLNIHERPPVNGIENLPQQRNALPPPRVEPANLGQRMVPQQPCAVGGALQPGVMNDDQLPLQPMHIDLDPVGSKLKGAAHGAEGVLRFQPAGAAMTDAEQGALLPRVRSDAVVARRIIQDEARTE